ncbi:MAG: hypothetical protein IJT73_02065 [Selenomonadaceae bacterium]|nr:hypothetical protein [Selenomonadaceae bacterium]
MEEFIEKFIENSWWIFCILILIWLVLLGWKDFNNSLDEDTFGDYEEPRTAASLGVFFTFAGIFLGLLYFNSSLEAMHQSVVNLLGGMKTAFATSILGMSIYIFLKYWQKRKQKNFPKSEISDEATVADLIRYLKKSDAEKSDATKKLLGTLEKISNSLAGDGEYTVVGQMKTIRLEMRDNNDKIISEFREFGKTLAENNTKAFIEALNEAIKDFNQKITEQFGENFKQLNIAVGRLLEWQINYKATLESVTQDLQIAFAGIDNARNSLAQIENSSAAIQNTAAAIQALIVTANLYEQKLEQVLLEVENLGDSAKNSIPNVINFVESSCGEIEKSVATAAANVDALSEKIHSSIIQTQINVANFVESSCNEIEKSVATAAANVDALSEKIHSSIIQTQINVANFVESSCNEIEKSVATAAANVDALSEKIHSATIQTQNNVVNLVESSCGEIEKSVATAANNFNDLSDEIHISITQAQEFSEKICDLASDSVTEFENFSNRTVQAMVEVSKRIEITSYKQREIMDAEIQATKNAVQTAAAILGEDAFKITKKISDSLYNMMETNNEYLKKSTKNLNENLDNLFKEKTKNFGEAMYNVSQKFVEDYTPLTNKLAALIRIAEDVERSVHVEKK